MGWGWSIHKVNKFSLEKKGAGRVKKWKIDQTLQKHMIMNKKSFPIAHLENAPEGYFCIV